MMESWMFFWKIICIIGFVAFYALVLAIIPFGLKDLKAFFKQLGGK